MERKLNKSIKRRKNLTRAIFLLAVLLYIGIPSFLGYLLFFSENAIANIDSVEGTFVLSGSDAEIPVFNDVLEPYNETFGLNTVTIVDGYQIYTYLTPVDTVSMIIEENTISFDANDIIIPDLNETISRNAVVQIIHIDTDRDTETLRIPFETVYQDDPKLPTTYQEVTQRGVEGEAVRRYDLQYENGVLVSKELLSETVTREPVTEIITIGTMTKDAYSGANGCTHWDSVIDTITSNTEERNWLKFMIRCESHCNTYAVNSNLYFGIMQFSEQLFYGAFNGEDIFDGGEQIEYSLSIYRSGLGARKFPYCSAKYGN